MSIDPAAFRQGDPEPERRTVYPKQKQYYNGCGVAGSGNTAFYEYPQGHPCRGCPYQFPVDVPSCTMGSRPPDCAWHFYKKLMKRRK